MTPEIRLDENGDHDIAQWLLDLVDKGPDRLAVVEIPSGTDDEIGIKGAIIREAYDIAKAKRPNLAVKLHPATDDYPDAAVLVIVHEHAWVGGMCVNGCRETRDVA